VCVLGLWRLGDTKACAEAKATAAETRSGHQGPRGPFGSQDDKGLVRERTTYPSPPLRSQEPPSPPSIAQKRRREGRTPASADKVLLSSISSPVRLLCDAQKPPRAMKYQHNRWRRSRVLGASTSKRSGVAEGHSPK
jgi:hypothetical protein